MPKIHPTAWVAPGAFVRGAVTIDEQANIWYNAVLRGDQESITVGKATSVQDNCVLHGDAGCNVVVGQYVTVGHGAVLHGCTVEDNCLIGMNAVVLDHAVIGAHCKQPWGTDHSVPRFCFTERRPLLCPTA